MIKLGEFTFFNLTPHSIAIEPSPNSERLTFPSDGSVRLKTITTEEPPIGGLPVVRNQFDKIEVEGLPEKLPPRSVLIVSLVIGTKALFLKEMTGAYAVVAPDTSPESAVRNEKGQIVAVRRFVLLA